MTARTAKNKRKNDENGGSAVKVARIGAIATVLAAVLGGIIAGIFALIAAHSGHGNGAVISDVSLNSKVKSFYSRCPLTFQFTGEIDVTSGTGEIAYRFLRQNGFDGRVHPGQIEKVAADGPGSITVADQWSPAIPYGIVSRTVTLEVVSPEDTRSNAVTISGKCNYKLPSNPPIPPPSVSPP